MLTNSRRRGRLVAYAVLIVAIAAGLFVLAFRNLGQWLAIDEPLQHSRAIVILGGGVPFRPMEAASLYRAGWAGQVWLSMGREPTDGDLTMRRIGLPPTEEYELSRAVLEKLGVPPAAIQVVPGYVENTAAEVNAILRFVPPSPVMPLILVGSKAQARRVRVIWDKVGKGRLPAIVRYGPDDPFDPAHWWTNSSDAFEVTHEVFGIVNAWAGFRIAPRKH